MTRLLAVLSCLFLVGFGEARSYGPGDGHAHSHLGGGPSLAKGARAKGETKSGTITTLRSPITRNVKVYRRSSVRSVRGPRGVTKITTTTTTTVTTMTRRVTVIKKVTTRAAKPARKRR